jgi:predicted O-methyltransferase YrrM
MNDQAPAKEHEALPKTSRSAMGKLLQEIFGGYKTEFVGILRRIFAEQLALQKTEIVEMLRAEVTEALRAEVQRAASLVQDSETGQYRNIQLAAQRLALLESAEFMRQHMLKASAFSHPRSTLEHALSLAPQGGLALEFGVYSGTTLKTIAGARQGGVYGFDSFQGLPEIWRTGFPAGAFAVDQLPQIEGAELVVGWFDETLPKFLENHAGTIDFLHVDCDLYSSSKTVFDLAGPRLRPGSIVLFDEFFNYPGWQQHEYKAWTEYVERTGTKFSYEAYTLNNEQVAARITAI